MSTDPFGRNLYPKCDTCGHDWHGLPCDRPADWRRPGQLVRKGTKCGCSGTFPREAAQEQVLVA